MSILSQANTDRQSSLFGLRLRSCSTYVLFYHRICRMYDLVYSTGIYGVPSSKVPSHILALPRTLIERLQQLLDHAHLATQVFPTRNHQLRFNPHSLSFSEQSKDPSDKPCRKSILTDLILPSDAILAHPLRPIDALSRRRIRSVNAFNHSTHPAFIISCSIIAGCVIGMFIKPSPSLTLALMPYLQLSLSCRKY